MTSQYPCEELLVVAIVMMFLNNSNGVSRQVPKISFYLIVMATLWVNVLFMQLKQS